MQINAIHCGGSSVKMPLVVRNAILASFESSSVSHNAAIPLLRDAMDFSEQLGHYRCVAVSRGFGRIHGLCYQNVSALERYDINELVGPLHRSCLSFKFLISYVILSRLNNE